MAGPSTRQFHDDMKQLTGQYEQQLKFLDENYALVVAIDFGTAFSGYAFSFKSNPDDVKTNRNWGTSLGMESYKTPTCILFDGSRNFKSFGYDAQKEYAELEDGLDQKYYYFDFFKMRLHTKKVINPNKKLKASNGKKMEAVKVFAEALKYLKGNFLGSLKDSNIEAKEEDVRWVITVPAIWSFKAKGFMREAALMGGLIDDRNSNKLLIALEPESGSIYCRNLDINQFADACRLHEMKLPKDTVYMVLDAGGGTLDVSVLKVLDKNKAEEIHCATGGAHGGSYVDKHFKELLDKILTKGFMADFTKKYPSQWLTMKIDFEQKKRACRADNTNTTKLQLLYQLGKAYEEYAPGESIDSALRGPRAKAEGVKISNGMIVLKHITMEHLFNDVVHDNVKHLQVLLEGMEESCAKPEDWTKLKPKYVFMVGGFSDSHLLQKSIIKNFGKGSTWDMQVMIPQEASLAVVKGAVKFGHNPLLITERKAMFCYGIKIRAKFKEGIHDPAKKKNDNGNDYVHLFDVKVKRNNTMETIGAGTYKPVDINQSVAKVELYYSENSDTDKPRYIPEKDQEDDDEDDDADESDDADKGAIVDDDEDIFHLHTILAPWKGKGMDRTIKIELELGGTELRMKTISKPGDEIKETIIDLLHEQNI